MLKEKKVWDIVNKSYVYPTRAAQIKKKDKDNAVASKIIKQEVNSNLYINIIREYNLYWL